MKPFMIWRRISRRRSSGIKFIVPRILGVRESAIARFVIGVETLSQAPPDIRRRLKFASRFRIRNASYSAGLDIDIGFAFMASMPEGTAFLLGRIAS